MRIIAILLIATGLLGGCSVSFDSGSGNSSKVSAGTTAQEKAVFSAATQFLREVDAGDASATWSKASPYLQERSSKAVWVTTIDAGRDALGSLKSRKIDGFGFTHTVKGLPNDNYAAVGFNTVFTNAKVKEKVVLQDDHGTWKVMGYFVVKTFSGHL